MELPFSPTIPAVPPCDGAPGVEVEDGRGLEAGAAVERATEGRVDIELVAACAALEGVEAGEVERHGVAAGGVQVGVGPVNRPGAGAAITGERASRGGVDRVDAREAARDAYRLVSAVADTVETGDGDIDCRGVVDRGVAALAIDAEVPVTEPPVEVEDIVTRAVTAVKRASEDRGDIERVVAGAPLEGVEVGERERRAGDVRVGVVPVTAAVSVQVLSMLSPVSVFPVPVPVVLTVLMPVKPPEASPPLVVLVSAEADTVGSGDDDVDCRGVS